MTRPRSSGARTSIAKIAAAAVLIAIPTATVSVPAYAAPADTPSVLPAPPPRIHPPMHHSRHRLRRHHRPPSSRCTRTTGGGRAIVAGNW